MCTIIEEEWRDISGYEGLYQVSNLGRVKSLNYLHHKGKVCIMSPTKDKSGYLRVGLCKEGKYCCLLVHRLVAEAFISNPDNLPQVNHKDENKKNNRADNLEWCTAKYNNNYGTAIERRSKKRSKKVLCVEADVIYESVNEAERQTGIHHSNIVNCCNGKRKTAGGYHWEYAE